MAIKQWSGKINIGKIEVEVEAITNNREWYGSGKTYSLTDSAYLYNEFIKRGEFNTQLGTLFISKINPTEQTFSFQGTGVPLF